MKNLLGSSTLRTDTFYATLSSGLDIGIVVLMVAIGRFLGEEEFGKLSFLQSLAVVFISWGNFGLNQIVIRDVSHDSTKAGEYASSVIPLTALLSLVALLLFIGYLYLSGDHQGNLIWIGIVVGFATVFRYLTMTFRAFSQALGRFDVEFKNVLRENVLLIPLCLLLLLLGYGLLETVIGMAFGRLLGFIMQSHGLSQVMGQNALFVKPDWSTALRLQKSAIPVGVGIAVAMLSLNVDTILLAHLTDFSQVGLYNASSKVFAGLLIIPSVANVILLPRISRAVVQGNPMNEFLMGSACLLVAGCGMVVTLGLFSTEIIVTLFGLRYAPAGDLLFWHLVVCIPAFQVLMARTYLIAVGKSQAFLVSTIVGLILRASFLLFVVPRFGLIAGVQVVFAAELITYLMLLPILLSTSDRPAMVAR